MYQSTSLISSNSIILHVYTQQNPYQYREAMVQGLGS